MDGSQLQGMLSAIKLAEGSQTKLQRFNFILLVVQTSRHDHGTTGRNGVQGAWVLNRVYSALIDVTGSAHFHTKQWPFWRFSIPVDTNGCTLKCECTYFSKQCDTQPD